MEIIRICRIDIEGSSLDNLIIVGELLWKFDADIGIFSKIIYAHTSIAITEMSCTRTMFNSNLFHL